VEHAGSGCAGDIGAVVDGQQCAVPARGVGEHLERCQLVTGFQRAQRQLSDGTLVAQLNHVHTAGQGSVGEFGQVTAITASVGAEVEPGAGEPITWVHTETLTTTVVSRHGSPGVVRKRGLRVDTHLSLPSNLIRIMPAKGAKVPPHSGSLAVIGGGVIGLSVARRAAQAGWSVRVHRSGQPGASWVAAGMLAPHSEGWPGEERLLQLGLDSLRLWRHGGFTDGLPPHVITARESLVVAVDRADVADLRTVADWLSAQGHPVVWESAVRDVEPMLAQSIRHGFRAPTELAVDNRALLEALSTACEQLGVEWDGPVTDLACVRADAVVIANGVDAPSLWPGLPIRPVKGEVLRLRWRTGCMPVPQRVVRARVHGRQVYVVPRTDGVVVGATQYEHGRDTAPTVSGVRDLLDDACAVMPALGEYEFAECIAGLRPMTPDNLPLVGRLDARTLVAAGHGRSGFLLAPWTAEQIVSELVLVGANT
jgi:glycine oxidase